MVENAPVTIVDLTRRLLRRYGEEVNLNTVILTFTQDPEEDEIARMFQQFLAQQTRQRERVKNHLRSRGRT